MAKGIPDISEQGQKAGEGPPSSFAGQAEEELACFFDNTLGLVCVAGFDGYFKRLNPVWEGALGWTLEELRAKPFIEFVHPDDRPATLSELDGLIQGRRTIFFENRYLCRDGSFRWFEWNATSLRDMRHSNSGCCFTWRMKLTRSVHAPSLFPIK